MKKLAVVIVSYNVKFYVEQCLIALQWATRDIDTEIYVVDNHSHDGSVDHLRRQFPDVNVISSNHNLGFSRANNLAIDQSNSEYVLLLNPDTVVTEDSIRQCIEFMDAHPKAGSCGVRMLKADGSNAMESRRGVPTPMTSLYKMIGLCSRYPNHPRFGRYYMSGISWTEHHEIEVVSGAFCMLRREAIDKVGTLDEDYFMYGEDIDLSYRLLQGGYENWYLPAVILHYKGESAHKSSFRYVHVFYDAMLIFFRKHFGHMSFLISLPIKVAIFIRAIIALVTMSVRGWRDSIGLRDRSSYQLSHFVFIGSDYTLSQCRSIARLKGLDAEFHEGTVGTMPEGHNTFALPEGRPVVVVYDVHAFSYNQIFDIFAANPRPNITIGTYDNHTRRIITVDEIIYDESMS